MAEQAYTVVFDTEIEIEIDIGISSITMPSILYTDQMINRKIYYKFSNY